jgi:preprotein translocase subunit YajC
MSLIFQQFTLFLAQNPPRPPEQPSTFTPAFFAVMVLIIAGFYFFIQKPQAKAQQEKEKAREGFKKGDAVVSIGGIHGRVARVNKAKDTVVVEVSKGVELEFSRVAVNPAPVEKEAKEVKDSKNAKELVEE